MARTLQQRRGRLRAVARRRDVGEVEPGARHRRRHPGADARVADGELRKAPRARQHAHAHRARRGPRAIVPGAQVPPERASVPFHFENSVEQHPAATQ